MKKTLCTCTTTGHCKTCDQVRYTEQQKRLDQQRREDALEARMYKNLSLFTF